jgi:hypothetical protein
VQVVSAEGRLLAAYPDPARCSAITRLAREVVAIRRENDRLLRADIPIA